MYFKNLIPALAKCDRQNEYHIFLPVGHEVIPLVQRSNFIFHKIRFNHQSAWRRHLWEQAVLPIEVIRKKIDVLYTAKNANVLLAPCRTIIAIRNLEPFFYGRYKNTGFLNFLSFLKRINSFVSMVKADHIIAVSQGVRAYLQKHYAQFLGKCTVIYNGNPVRIDEISRLKHKSTQTYLLSSSKFVAYANQKNLVLGYALLRKKRKQVPPLWLAGGIHDGEYYDQVRNLVKEKKLRKHVKFLGYRSHREILKLYANARAFVFPSTLEACPHTLIEAMSFKLPVATSNFPPMPEICKKAARYFNPEQPEKIANALEKILFDRKLRKSLVFKGQQRCKEFNWVKTAKKLINIFKA